jgi:hypothetical protein
MPKAINNTHEITYEIVRELLDYFPMTGHFRWKRRDQKWFVDERAWKLWNTRCAGKRAFSVGGGMQYSYATILNKSFATHRVAFLWMTGRWPEPETDHINRVKNDNRWSNLREATTSQNQRNRSLNYNNKSGVTGVRLLKNGRYTSRLANERLGCFTTFEEAVAARKAAEQAWRSRNRR